MKIVSLVRLSRTDVERIRAIDGGLELVEAGGWFDGEYAETWPPATVERYVASSGQGSRQERDAMLSDARIVVAGFPYPLDLAARTPRLQWLHQSPAGASNLRRGDIWGRDVLVTTSRGYGETQAIAEYAIAGLLHFAKRFDQAEADRARGEFDHGAYAVGGIAGKTLCVIGAGGIGRDVARLGEALGMRVVGTRRNVERSDADAPFERIEAPDALHALLAESDFIAVCCQWTPQTTGLLVSDAFAATKSGAILVNVARGEIVDESALLNALDEGTLGGAVLDVYVGEFDGPPPQRLWRHPKVLITPHTSTLTDHPRRRAVDLFCANLRRFLAGEELENLIDWDLGY